MIFKLLRPMPNIFYTRSSCIKNKNMDLRTKVVVPEGTSYTPEDMTM